MFRKIVLRGAFLLYVTAAIFGSLVLPRNIQTANNKFYFVGFEIEQIFAIPVFERFQSALSNTLPSWMGRLSSVYCFDSLFHISTTFNIFSGSQERILNLVTGRCLSTHFSHHDKTMIQYLPSNV